MQQTLFRCNEPSIWTFKWVICLRFTPAAASSDETYQDAYLGHHPPRLLSVLKVSSTLPRYALGLCAHAKACGPTLCRDADRPSRLPPNQTIVDVMG